MRISKRIILRTAEDLMREKGKFTQIEIHEEIEKILGRDLTINDKRRITQILNREFTQERIEKKKDTYEIIRIFTL